MLVAAVTGLAPGAPCAAQALTETLRLGGIEATDAEAFSREPSLLLSPSGRLYVIDGTARVTVFSADGEFEAFLGGPGEGPGEFRMAMGFGMVGDSLWVRNWTVPRISVFHDLVHVRTKLMPWDFTGPFSDGPQGVTALMRDGWVFATPSGIPLTDQARHQVPMVVSTGLGSTSDTIAMRETPFGMSIAGVGSFQHAPTARPPLYALIPGGRGIVIGEWDPAEPGQLALRRFDQTGRLTGEFEWASDAARINRGARNAMIERGLEVAEGPFGAAQRAGDVPRSLSLREAVERGLDLPEFYPPIRSFFVDNDERIWLHAMTPTDTKQWVVLDPAGRELGRVDAPAGVDLKAASGNTVWGTWTDAAYGAPFIARYELTGAAWANGND